MGLFTIVIFRNLLTITLISLLALSSISSVFFYKNDNGLDKISAFGQTDVKDWKKYENTYFGIEISYPPDWYIDHENVDYENDVSFFSDFEDRYDVYDERMVLIIERLNSDVSLNDYTEVLRRTFSGGVRIIEESSSVTLSGYRAHSAVFDSYLSDDNVSLKGKAIWTVVNGRAYLLESHAEDKAYDAYIPIFNKMINSFKITDTSPDKEPIYHTFYGTEQGFSIQYPETWSVETDRESAPADEVVIFFSPWHGYMIDNDANIDVSVADVPRGTTLASYTENALEVYQEFRDFKLLESKDTKLSGNDAHQIVYTWKSRGIDLERLEIWTLKGTVVYHLTFEMEQAVFSEYEPIFQHVVNTFELSGSTIADIQNVPLSTYENSDYGIKIQYPETWSQVGPAGGMVTFMSPLTDNDDNYRENVQIKVADHPSSISLEELTRFNINDLNATVKEFKLIESKSITLDGHPAHTIVYSGVYNNINFQSLAAWTVLDNRAYNIWFYGKQVEYETYLPVIQKMLDSFEIDESKVETGLTFYENSSIGIKLLYPTGWIINEETEPGKPPVIEFKSKEDFTVFRPSFIPLLWNMTNEELARSMTEMLSKDFDELSLVESKPITLAGYPGYKLVYNARLNIPEQTAPFTQPVAYTNVAQTVQIKVALLYTIQNNAVYYVMYGTTSDRYLNFVETANKIVESLEIDPNAISSKISGSIFEDKEAEIQIKIPEGWAAYQLSYSDSTLVTIFSPVTEDKASIALQIGNLKDVIEESQKSEDESACQTPKTVNVVYLEHKVKAIEYETDCEFYGKDAKTKTYAMLSEDKRVLLGLFAETEDAYKDSLDAFEGIGKSLTFEDSIDLSSDEHDDLLGVTSEDFEVTALENQYVVETSTSSNSLSNFAFDEDQKKISFTVEGESGTKGSATIFLGNVLSPPYVVTIDGEVTDNHSLVNDSTTNRTGIRVYYLHDAHNIVVSGTRVIPEFPVTMVGVIAAIIGLVVVVTRTKLYRPQSGHQ